MLLGRFLATPARRMVTPIAAAAVGSGRSFATTPALLNLRYEGLRIASVKEPAPEHTAAAVVNGQIQENFALIDPAHYTVLLFYPLDFTFVCPTELTAFSDRSDEFAKLGAKVVAVSVDSAYSHLAWTKQPRKEGGIAGMKIPLVADLTKDISRSYGVLLEDEGIALRGLFIIDKKKVVRTLQVTDLSVGRSVDETLRLLSAVKEFDDTGCVTPCGWTRGQKTILVEKAAEYFSTSA